MTVAYAQPNALPAIMLHPFSAESIGSMLYAITGLATPASATWPTANLGYFFPLCIAAPITIYKLWWANGSAVAGTVDVGLYASGAAGPAARLTSAGATTQAGTNVLQSVDITDLTIDSGRYYIALSASSTSATLIKSTTSTTQTAKALSTCQQASVGTLPDPATPVVSVAIHIPLFGLALRTTI